MRLGSKIALVTGAGGGLGGATAIRFATEGAKVVCSDIDLAKAEKTVSMIESRGGTAIAYQCDIADIALVGNSCPTSGLNHGNGFFSFS